MNHMLEPGLTGWIGHELCRAKWKSTTLAGVHM